MPPPPFKAALAAEDPLRIAGVVNAYCALLAHQVGFRALYVSGAGVANASFGLPDLGLTTRSELLEDVRRVTAVTDRPVLVDADTGFGNPLAVARTARELARAGAAAMHLEDQVHPKRCGHRPGKVLALASEMVDRIKAAVDGRPDDGFVVMARTDAAANEGLEAAIERANLYVRSGADMIFAEALGDLDQFGRFTKAVGVPVLANMTEFGVTPLFTVEQLRSVGVRMALYPLSAFRAMNAAALRVYETIHSQGTQASVVDAMQSRDDLYRVLRYHEHEKKVDQMLEERS